MAPVTGDYASAGEQIRRGLELAREDLRAENRSVELIFEDACLPATGVAAFKELVLLDKVQAVVSNYCIISLSRL